MMRNTMGPKCVLEEEKMRTSNFQTAKPAKIADNLKLSHISTYDARFQSYSELCLVPDSSNPTYALDIYTTEIYMLYMH